jgi:hypothetical protein
MDSKRSFEIKAHGFDEGKFNPASMFFFPVQAQNAEYSFFRDYADGRKAINPYTWIDRTVIDHRPEPDLPTMVGSARNAAHATIAHAANDDLPSSNQERIDNAIAAWRAAPAGSGNQEFNRLAWKLLHAGMDLYDVQATLRSEAGYGRSPADRKSQISSVMSNLRRKAGSRFG